jgi:hypothetical protein
MKDLEDILNKAIEICQLYEELEYSFKMDMRGFYEVSLKFPLLNKKVTISLDYFEEYNRQAWETFLSWVEWVKVS